MPLRRLVAHERLMVNCKVGGVKGLALLPCDDNTWGLLAVTLPHDNASLLERVPVTLQRFSVLGLKQLC